MINMVRVITYIVLISFFSSVIYNAFLFPKGLALYKYLFGSIDSYTELVIYYVVKSLPAIIMNFFIILVLKNVLDIAKSWLILPFYIVFFLAFETMFFYFINRAYFIENNNIYHYLLSFLVYSISLWALTFPNFSNSSLESNSVNDLSNGNNEKTEL